MKLQALIKTRLSVSAEPVLRVLGDSMTSQFEAHHWVWWCYWWLPLSHQHPRVFYSLIFMPEHISLCLDSICRHSGFQNIMFFVSQQTERLTLMKYKTLFCQWLLVPSFSRLVLVVMDLKKQNMFWIWKVQINSNYVLAQLCVSNC